MSPPPSPSGDPRRLTVGLGALLLALMVLRLVAAQAIPLTEDEAYYRLWAQHLRLGYYDHPPMIAWWIRAGMTAAGDGALGVRLLPVAASLVASLLVFDLGARLKDRPTGLAAVLLYNATLTVGWGAVLAVPDAAASLFWTLALWALARSREHATWWLAAGAAAGLACLSKYSALFLAPGVLLWLVLTPEGRRRLLTPWPWLAAVLAAVLFGLNVWWNATHDWMTFHRQFGRVAPARFAPRYLGEFLGGQFVLLNPAVAVLAAAGAVRAWRTRQPLALLAAASGAPFLLYLAVHSLHDRVQAHWPVPLYPGAALLAAFAAAESSGWRRRVARVAPLGIALTALALGYMAFPRSLLGPRDPAEQLRGWPQLAEQVDGVRQAHGGAWVGTLSYAVNGLLQAQPGTRAPVLQLNERERYRDLPSAHADLARPGLVVDLDRRVDMDLLRTCFSGVGAPVRIARGLSGAGDARYVAVPVTGARPDLPARGCEPPAKPSSR